MYSFTPKLVRAMNYPSVVSSKELLARALECVAEELRTTAPTPLKISDAVSTALHAVLDEYLGPESSEAEAIERVEFVTAMSSKI